MSNYNDFDLPDPFDDAIETSDEDLDLSLDLESDSETTDISYDDLALNESDSDREQKINEAVENRKNNIGQDVNLNPVVDINQESDTDPENKEDILVGPDGDPVKAAIDAYNTFDQIAWSKKSGYQLPHFPFMQKKLEGLDEGLYLFAAESNAGKTALMTNVLYDACTCKENHLVGLYFSLDDSKQLVIPRVISMVQNIPISASAKPYTYQELYDKANDSDPKKNQYKDYLDKREAGLKKLINNANCFQIKDNNDGITSAEDIYKCIQSMVTYVKAMYGDDYNLIVAIDALDDLRFKNERFQSDTDRHKLIAKTCKDWATEFHIPVFGSRHLNKIRMDRKPCLDDLKDTSEYVYEATLVFLLYNEVGKKGQSANVCYTRADQQNLPENQREKQPVIEIAWAKNKASSYKGKSYCYFFPEFSKMIEVSEQDKAKYDAISY